MGGLHERIGRRQQDSQRRAATAGCYGDDAASHGGNRLLSDGRFAETKEQLGCFFIVEATVLGGAVEVASKMPHL
jgi:hypothetical protein